MVSVDLDLAATFVPRLRHVCATFVPRLCHVATCVAFLPQDRAITLQQLLRVVDFSKEMGPLKKCWCPYRSHAEAMQNLRDRDEQSPLNAKDLKDIGRSFRDSVALFNFEEKDRQVVFMQ